MNYTEKLKLRKPEGGEYYSIEDFNGNADLIDSAISGKVNKPTEYTTGNFPTYSASGNIEDSGKKPADFAAAAHNHDKTYAPITHANNTAVHVGETDKAAIAAVSKKADRTYVDSALSAKANVRNCALTGSGTLNGEAIATATSAQAVSVPLASDFTGWCVVSKNQFGQIDVALRITSGVSEVNKIFAILPEGFRPANVRYYPAVAQKPDGTAIACVLASRPNGELIGWEGITGAVVVTANFRLDW